MNFAHVTPACQVFDADLDVAVAKFLGDDRWPITNIALGFKSVIKNIGRSRMRVVILAVDLDSRVHALLHTIVTAAAHLRIPVVFALPKYTLGRALGLTGAVGCVAIYENAPMTPARARMLSRVFVLAAKARVEHLKHVAHLATLDVVHTYTAADVALVGATLRSSGSFGSVGSIGSASVESAESTGYPRTKIADAPVDVPYPVALSPAPRRVTNGTWLVQEIENLYLH